MSERVYKFRAEGLDEVANEVETTNDRIGRSNEMSLSSYRKLSFGIIGITGHVANLGDLFDRMAKGQIDAGRAAMLLFTNLLGLVGPILSIASALKTKAIADAIANVASSGWLAPVMAAVIGGAIVGVAYAVDAAMPKRAFGGDVPFTGTYQLHAGEYVNRGGSPSININIYGNITPDAVDPLSKSIARELKASGVV